MRGRFLNKVVTVAICVALFIPEVRHGISRLMTQGAEQTRAATSATPVLDTQHQQHILYGDGNGGGHLYGMGKACESEFPASWNAQAITSTITRLAANDNLRWQTAPNGYDVAETYESGVQIRLVVDRRRNLIITAYPLNTPRHACPRHHGRNANDNYR